MIDIFGTLLAWVLFLAALIFVYIDWAHGAYSEYSFQKKQYEWEIQFAQQKGLQNDVDKNKFLQNKLETEHKPEMMKYIIILGCIIVFICIAVAILSSQLPAVALIQSDETSSEICQNVTSVVNNYYYNYTIERINIENSVRAFPVREYLMQPRQQSGI